MSDDLISRQAAIDALLHNQEVYANHFGNDPIDKYTIALIDNDAQTIAQLPSAQRWIPVSERLPEEPFGCIVSYHGFMLTPHGEREYDAIYPDVLGFDGYGWNNSEGECVDNMIDVTAWMPLPEPYKEA